MLALKRLLGRAAAGYLVFAIIGKYVERMGAVRCGCRDSCWCRKPGLSTFRWVAPFGHDQMTADEKRRLDPNATWA
ncbi:MAG: hypothetical protein JF603_00620 [Acidobacteria bacterium]|nr:hypothetical protein [Acidobacteriota bacterium]